MERAVKHQRAGFRAHACCGRLFCSEWRVQSPGGTFVPGPRRPGAGALSGAGCSAAAADTRRSRIVEIFCGTRSEYELRHSSIVASTLLLSLLDPLIAQAVLQTNL
jgi:hypothetical protein